MPTVEARRRASQKGAIGGRSNGQGLGVAQRMHVVDDDHDSVDRRVLALVDDFQLDGAHVAAPRHESTVDGESLHVRGHQATHRVEEVVVLASLLVC